LAVTSPASRAGGGVDWGFGRKRGSASETKGVSQCPHENPLGSDHRRLPDRAVHGLGRDQWTAWQLGFQPQLGCLVRLAGWPVYIRLLLVVVLLRRLCASIFVHGAYIAASGGFLSAAVAIGMSVWRAREAKNVETYGSARWARPDEVKARGCSARMASCSASSSTTISAMTARACLCFAPTRSGKGVGLVVPSL
jgi:type IV secretion system protein VirD4